MIIETQIAVQDDGQDAIICVMVCEDARCGLKGRSETCTVQTMGTPVYRSLSVVDYARPTAPLKIMDKRLT